MLTQSYLLPMTPCTRPLEIPAGQYESAGRTLTLSLMDDTPFSIPAGAVVTLTGQKPDGTCFSYLPAVSGNAVTVPLTAQMTAVSGSVPCRLEITQGEDMLASALFYLKVAPSPLPEQPDFSASELSALQQLSAAAVSAAQTAQNAANAAEQTLSGKADKAVPAAAGNIALLNAAGSLMDSGKQLTPAAIGAAPALSRGSYFGSLSQVTNTSGGLYDNSLVWFGSSNGTTDLPKEGFGFCMTLGNTGGDLQLLFYVDGTVAVRIRYDTGSGNQWHDWVWVKS